MSRKLVVTLSAALILAPLAASAEGVGVGGFREPPGALFELVGLAFAALGLVGVVALCASAGLRQILIPRPAESLLAEKLQFDAVLKDGKTIRCKDGQLVQTIEIGGVDYGTKTEPEIAALLIKRHAWFQGLGRDGRAVKLLSLRDKARLDVGAAYENDILQEIHDRWLEAFETVYVNRYFLVVSVPQGRGAQKALDELAKSVLEGLHDFNPRVLELGRGDVSPLLSFWARLVNGFRSDVPPAFENVGEHLVRTGVTFDHNSGLIEYQQGPAQRFGLILSVKIWGDAQSDELIHRLMSLNGTVQISALLFAQKKEKTTAFLPLRAKQAALLTFNRIKAAEFEAVTEVVQADRDGVFECQFSVLLEAEVREELDELVSQARRVFVDAGIVPVFEMTAAEWVWRARLPGFAPDVKYATRPRSLLGVNVSELVTFQEEPSGLDRCDWGEGPIRPFKTVTGAPYSFQFHVSEAEEALAHTVTFAPSGGGKTTLFSHLMGGALRHPDLAVYAFDRHGGLQVFTEAVGGRYIDPSTTDVELNPLQMPDTPENRQYLHLWLRRLADADDDESFEAATRAVDAIFRIKRVQSRSLMSVYESAFDTGSKLKAGLGRWVGQDFASAMFNGATDSLNLEGSRLVTFEMAQALNDPRVAGALVSYIMHRIRETCRASGRPHLVFVDETAALLADEAFRKDTEVMLREHRKLRGSVNVVFQDCGVMNRSGISETILNNCPTQIIFQNPNAREEDYRVLDLTEGQWAYVKGQSRIARHLPRSVLLKRGQEAVILDVDLSPLGPLVKIYRSGSQPVQLMRQLQTQVGEQWLEPYLASSDA